MAAATPAVTKKFTMLEVRPILPEHWPVLKDVRLRALADAPGAFGTTLAQAQAYSDAEWQGRARRFSESPPAAGCLAFVDGVPCGMASAFPSAENTHAAELTAFWVAPDSRGQGVADAMAAFAAAWALAQGFAVLEAGVVEDNHRAIGFYKRVGSVETGHSEPFRGDPSKQITGLSMKVS